MQIQCKQCGAMTDLPPGTDPHTRTWCGCCTITNEDGTPHHHGEAAASCPGNNGSGHPGEPCNHPSPKACTVLTGPGEDCPGGHCGPGVAGCTVCRPVTHFPVAGDPMGLVT